MNLPVLALPQSDRINVPVHADLYELCLKQKKPTEHRWQLIQRLLLAGIEAEKRKAA